jgi:hypothetical protein
MELAALRVVAGQVQGEVERAHAAASSARLEAISGYVDSISAENAELRSLLGMLVASVPFLGSHLLGPDMSFSFRAEAFSRLSAHWSSIQDEAESFLQVYPELWRGHYDELCDLLGPGPAVHREDLARAGGLRDGAEEDEFLRVHGDGGDL